jgi:uncharacterized protein (TIGR02001 family)
MKKLHLVFAALVLAATVVATPALAAIEVTGDAYVGYFSKYVWRGIDLSGGMPVVQSGVDLSAEGFTLSYWTNIATRNDDTNNDGDLDFEGGQGTENDLILNYAIPVGEIATINVGNIYYMLDNFTDTNELYAGATFKTLLSPTVKIFYDWDQADENGLFYTASVSHSLPVGDKVTLSASALVSYNDESDYSIPYDDPDTSKIEKSYSEWHNYELSAKADFKVTDQLTITPSILFSEGLSDESRDVLDSQLVGGVNLMFTF